MNVTGQLGGGLKSNAMRKPEGGRSERDFASAMGATATQKRSLRNARPRAAARMVAAVRAVAMSTAAVRAEAVRPCQRQN